MIDHRVMRFNFFFFRLIFRYVISTKYLIFENFFFDKPQIVYFQLLNLHGKTVVCYVISLLSACIALAIVQFQTESMPKHCLFIGKIVLLWTGKRFTKSKNFLFLLQPILYSFSFSLHFAGKVLCALIYGGRSGKHLLIGKLFAVTWVYTIRPRIFRTLNVTFNVYLLIVHWTVVQIMIELIEHFVSYYWNKFRKLSWELWRDIIGV